MFRRIAIILILTAACLAQEKAQPDTVARMEQIVQSYLPRNQFMGTVLVAQDGKILLDKGYGFANLEWEVPNTPTTKFLVGTYELRPDFSIVMTLEDGHLMTQATNQPKFPVFAESETRFFLKVVDAQVEFVKNEKGEVTNLVLHQGGRDVKGVKK
jgi:Domain of unknown function (DUF3471)